MKELNSLKDLKGLAITKVDGLFADSDEIIFYFDDGNVIFMFHEQDCYENVFVADVCGDIKDLLNSEIIHFEERVSDDCSSELSNNYDCCSETWTFYDIQTKKGCVNIRWHGESNGYYSERVNVNSGKKIGGKHIGAPFDWL